MNNVFFSENGLTSTSANHVANLAMETKTLPIQKEIDWAYIEEHFKKHLPYRPQLTYIDYRDDLEYCMKQVAEAVEKNDFLDLENFIDESYMEERWYNENEYWEAFQKNVLDELDDMYEALDDHYGAEADHIEAVRQFIEDEDDCKECFREYLWEHDDSGDVCKELMDKTDNPGMFYDLNEWFDETWCWDSKVYGEAIKRICKALGLNIKDKKTRDTLYELLANASGGGNLRIYFNCPIWDLVSGDENGCKYGTDGKYDYKSIRFKGTFMVAIINMWEGSGFTEDMELDTSIQFNRENLRISKQETYSYERVFGAYSDYKVDTPEFSFQEPDCKVEPNGELVYHQKREDEYNKTYRSGKCTCGDMNMSRHRHIVSVGWGDLRCKDCGTTWYCD